MRRRQFLQNISLLTAGMVIGLPTIESQQSFEGLSNLEYLKALCKANGGSYISYHFLDNKSKHFLPVMTILKDDELYLDLEAMLNTKWNCDHSIEPPKLKTKLMPLNEETLLHTVSRWARIFRAEGVVSCDRMVKIYTSKLYHEA
jgi:hypothetical protein